MLVQATMYHQTFWGRVGAATLLGYLQQTPDLFDKALLSGLYDVAPVQTAIFQMVQNLRYVDERMIPKLLLLLDHESASVVYAISRLLASIARNEKISPTLRQRIVRALNDTIQRRDSLRPVFLIEEANANIFIRNIGRLDQQLYSAINNIIGIAWVACCASCSGDLCDALHDFKQGEAGKWFALVFFANSKYTSRASSICSWVMFPVENLQHPSLAEIQRFFHCCVHVDYYFCNSTFDKIESQILTISA